MDFLEKLRRLTAETSKARVAKAAGLPSAAISNYLSKRQMPRGDNALSLARALDVPLDWLLDDAKGWPPPENKRPAVTDLTDDELMLEVARRHRLAVLHFLNLCDRAAKVDWKGVAEQLAELPPDAELPPVLHAQAALAYSLASAYMTGLLKWELQFVAALHHAELPGADRFAGPDLVGDKLVARYEEVTKRPSFDAVINRLEKRPGVALPSRDEVRRWKWLLRLHDTENGEQIDKSAARALDSPRSRSGRKRKA